MDKFIVAIDGPAGAGKSTVAKEAAKRMEAVYVDTGAMYRAVALFVIENNIADEDITTNLDKIDIDIRYIDGMQKIYLGGVDVSDKIRTPEVSMGASKVAVIPEVRLKLVELQRSLATKQSVIMDGRDIGTYVFPNADVKIFLTASAEERAKRRYAELLERGIEVSEADILADIIARDKNDSGRAFAPLKQAEDAILVDTSALDLDETIEKVTEIITRGVRK